MTSCQRVAEQPHLGGGLFAAGGFERAQRETVLRVRALDRVGEILEIVGARGKRGGSEDQGQQDRVRTAVTMAMVALAVSARLSKPRQPLQKD